MAMLRIHNPLDVIGNQLRLQWADLLSVPLSDVLQNIVDRLYAAEGRQEWKVLPNRAEMLDALLTAEAPTLKSKELLAELRASIARMHAAKSLEEHKS